ncbi:hypothetical protein BD410DRAFT_841464 [Rickenella mellea]|uniref:Uncharacterized protein n=1 Tax=Rickenella mellea TaxID=50990 RepID=A0A4Y7PYD8_9AGAM|nr:hypothetical protein BD410DRAFT_841464 [Rickenella mellea]
MAPSHQHSGNPGPSRAQNVANATTTDEQPANSESTTSGSRHSVHHNTASNSAAQAPMAAPPCPRSNRSNRSGNMPRSGATSSTAAATPAVPVPTLPTVHSQPENLADTHGTIRASDSLRTMRMQIPSSRTASMSISEASLVSRPTSEPVCARSRASHASAVSGRTSANGLLNLSFIQPPPEELLAENAELRRLLAIFQNEQVERRSSRSGSTRHSARVSSVGAGHPVVSSSPNVIRQSPVKASSQSPPAPRPDPPVAAERPSWRVLQEKSAAQRTANAAATNAAALARGMVDNLELAFPGNTVGH